MARSIALASGLFRFLFDVVGLIAAGALVVWAIVPDQAASRLVVLAPYLMTLSVVYVLVAMALGVNRSVWRFTSLEDLGIVAIAIGISIILTLGLGFVINRLDGVFRSLPLLQGAIAVFSSWLVRALFVMHWRLRNRRRQQSALRTAGQSDKRDHVLIVGVNQLANLYISGIAEFAGSSAEVVGLLSQEQRHKGRLVQQCKVLGHPVDVLSIMGELRVHGVHVSLIVIAMPFDSLPEDSREALLEAERLGEVALVFLSELLGLQRSKAVVNHAAGEPMLRAPDPAQPVVKAASALPARVPHTPYLAVKRAMDFVGALTLSILLAPLALAVSMLVLVNDRTPILFWQKRPGRFGQPLRIFKFRTMRRAHNSDGNRIPDAARTTAIGRTLRRLRLDEIPQLYLVLIGAMSFVGPRPLLPADQDDGDQIRLSMRPGITGYAQVCGCNRLSIEEKMALDEWYVENVSLALDVSIVLKTVRTLVRGECRDEAAIAKARAARAVRIAAIEAAGADVEAVRAPPNPPANSQPPTEIAPGDKPRHDPDVTRSDQNTCAIGAMPRRGIPAGPVREALAS